MASTIKWILLSVIFALASLWLYMAIDSEWSQRNNASIWITICFFLAAVATILCGFNAIDKDTLEHREG